MVFHTLDAFDMTITKGCRMYYCCRLLFFPIYFTKDSFGNPIILECQTGLKPNFSDQFKKIVKRYIRVGYNLDIMRQSACLVVNPITVYSYGFLFNSTTVGRASDSMTALT